MKAVKLIFKILSVILAVAVAIVTTGGIIADENFALVTAYLGQSTVERVTTDGAVTDTDYYKTDYEDIAALKQAGYDLIERVEAEGAVLLKNDDGALPLNAGGGEDKISLFGIESLVDYTVYFGNSSAKTSAPDKAISFKDAFEAAGLTVNGALFDFYNTYAKNFAPNYGGFRINDASWTEITSISGVKNSFENFCDAAVVVVSRSGGEGADLPLRGGQSDGEGGNYLALNEKEKSVFSGLASLKGTVFKKIIVILNSANKIETDFLFDDQYKIDACLWIGFPGVTGLNSVGKIMTGEINPSGKLSDTYWNKNAYDPAMKNFGAYNYSDIPSGAFGGIAGDTGSLYYDKYVVYQEGVYVGYRYAETRYFDVVMGAGNVGQFDYEQNVGFPFGYGLTYTRFEYSDMKCEYLSASDGYRLSVTVKNVGDTSGKEAVQFYLSKPYTQYDRDNFIEKPAVELVEYAKTKTLAPGESETVSVFVGGDALASYDAYGAGTYVIDAGDYYFIAARDSHAATNNLLATLGKGISDGMTDDGDAALVKKVQKNFDKTTYSRTADGVEIVNLFDYGDINRYKNAEDNSVTYLSRSDWQGTLPTDYVKLSMTGGMIDDIRAQCDGSLIKNDYSDYPTLGADNGLKLIDLREREDGEAIPYDDKLWDDLVDEMTWDELTYLLTEGKRMTAAVESVVKPETVDHNGPLGLTQPYKFGVNGLATMYGDDEANSCPPYYPCVGVLAATFNKEIAQEVGKTFGEDALWAGYSGLYGVSMNVHRTAYDGRFAEYYSEDGLLSGKQAAAFTVGLQSKGCNAYIKHVAAYEQQAARIGLGVWMSEQTFREIYLKAFRITSLEGRAMNAMTSYTRIGVTLSPASRELCTDFLRGECDLQGFVVTDMFDNRYIDASFPLMIMAGCDLPDGNRSAAGIFDGYAEGYANVARQMKLAAKRILYATVHSNAMNGFDSNVVIRTVTPEWKKTLDGAKTALIIAFAVCVCAFVALTALSARKR